MTGLGVPRVWYTESILYLASIHGDDFMYTSLSGDLVLEEHEITATGCNRSQLQERFVSRRLLDSTSIGLYTKY